MTRLAPPSGANRGGAEAPLLAVSDLSVYVPTQKGQVAAVADVRFDIAPGETLCLVGESASGKSLTALSLIGLTGTGVRIEGSVSLRGRSLVGLDDTEMARIRGREVAMVFQEAIPALNPVHPIGAQIVEALRQHHQLPLRAARVQAVALLDAVGIQAPSARMQAYPHEMSGGMAQRVMIAMALAARPALLIADEPTTALDVTVQAQILDLIDDLRRARGMAMLLITHDMGLVAEMADRVAVLYAGRIVELAPVRALFAAPWHPYTQALLAARPSLDTARRGRAIPGEAPPLTARGAGCAFAPRCPLAQPVCASVAPNDTAQGPRRVACHFPFGAP